MPMAVLLELPFPGQSYALGFLANQSKEILISLELTLHFPDSKGDGPSR